MMRGALVGLVYEKTLRSQSNGHDMGRAVTLMNTDIDSLATIARMAHDIWAYTLELVIGMVILAFQVGWLAPVPLVIILCGYSSLCRFPIYGINALRISLLSS